MGSLANARRTFRFAEGKLSEAEPQPPGIELIDRKYSDATLCASGATDKPFAAAPRSVSQSSVDDLNQFLVVIPILNAILSVILNSKISNSEFIFDVAGR